MGKKAESHHITLQEASELTPYDANYLGLLVRKKKLPAQKVKGRWMTTPEDVRAYMEGHSRVRIESVFEGAQTKVLSLGLPGKIFGGVFAVVFVFLPAVVFWVFEIDSAEKIAGGNAQVRVVSEKKSEHVSIFNENVNRIVERPYWVSVSKGDVQGSE